MSSAPAAGAARAAPTAAARAAAPAPVAARAATTQVARSGMTPVAARSAATPVAARSGATPIVAARAATVQKTVGSVAPAAQNTILNDDCKLKYYGCMDSFCMIENASGGRCVCSDRIMDLDEAWNTIQDLDTTAGKMATEGVDSITMGNDENAAEANANVTAITNQISKDQAAAKPKKADLSSIWEAADSAGVADLDIFSSDSTGSLASKKGDALHRAAADVCLAQIPECKGQAPVLKMLYANTIAGDCTAYENELKKQKTDLSSKVGAAERALRDAALEAQRTANKWDLGQCTVEFKKCMSATAGCKDDFTGCVGLDATGQTSAKLVAIKGSATSIMITASTMDVIESKKPLCMNVTNSCTRVRDQVWDTFLREVGPQLKTAELLAQSDQRSNCIASISQCFQKACKDSMDPSDPDGSFDLCLTRPEAIKSLCKIQIDPCIAIEPLILDFVYA